MLSRDTGHSRVPAPPHMITGIIWAGMREHSSARARSIAWFTRSTPHSSRDRSYCDDGACLDWGNRIRNTWLLLEQTAIERNYVLPDPLCGELSFHKRAARRPKMTPKLGSRASRSIASGQRLHVADRNQNGVEIRPCNGAAARHVGGDERAPTSRRLQKA